jgi:hypothetical protein
MTVGYCWVQAADTYLDIHGPPVQFANRLYSAVQPAGHRSQLAKRSAAIQAFRAPRAAVGDVMPSAAMMDAEVQELGAVVRKHLKVGFHLSSFIRDPSSGHAMPSSCVPVV